MTDQTRPLNPAAVVPQRLAVDLVEEIDQQRTRAETAEAERDQLRYERRLLGTCLVFLDGLAKNATSINLQHAAADLAQRIVDEIGHPVTDEPALGPNLRAEITKLREQLADAYGAGARSATEADNLREQLDRANTGRQTLAQELAAITAQRDRTILELANTPLVELITAATEAHYIVSGRTDAMGNNPCTCDEWWDSIDGPGWDEHLAEVAVSALAAAGRLAPAGITAALPELGEHLARREAVIRDAIAWRKTRTRRETSGGEFHRACVALAAAVDALPHAGEPRVDLPTYGDYAPGTLRSRP